MTYMFSDIKSYATLVLEFLLMTILFNLESFTNFKKYKYVQCKYRCYLYNN